MSASSGAGGDVRSSTPSSTPNGMNIPVSSGARERSAGTAVDDTCASHHACFWLVNFFFQVPLNHHTRPSEVRQPCHPGLNGRVLSRPLRVCRLELDDDKQPTGETSKLAHTRIIIYRDVCESENAASSSSPPSSCLPHRAHRGPGPVVLTITEVFPNPRRQSGEGSRGLEYLLRERLQPTIQPSRSSVPIQRPQPPHLDADYRCSSTERRGHWTTSPIRVLDAAPRGRTTTTCAFLGTSSRRHVVRDPLCPLRAYSRPSDSRWWRPAAIAQVPFHESDLYATLGARYSGVCGGSLR